MIRNTASRGSLETEPARSICAAAESTHDRGLNSRRDCCSLPPSSNRRASAVVTAPDRVVRGCPCLDASPPVFRVVFFWSAAGQFLHKSVRRRRNSLQGPKLFAQGPSTQFLLLVSASARRRDEHVPTYEFLRTKFTSLRRKRTALMTLLRCRQEGCFGNA